MPAANDSETPRRSTPVYARLMRPHRTCIITAKSSTASAERGTRLDHAGVEASYVSEAYILHCNIAVKQTEELRLHLWKTTPLLFRKNAPECHSNFDSPDPDCNCVAITLLHL